MDSMMHPLLLVAESDPEYREVHRRLFAARSYDVQTAADGRECLAKLRRTIPAAVVLDWDLPWGGGNGVLAWLREEQAAPGVAVVLTATVGQAPAVPGVIEPPVVHLLLKPLELPTLLENVRSAVAKGQAAARKAGHTPLCRSFFSAEEEACP
jgi:two-component system chemotaxis response regulator CheY